MPSLRDWIVAAGLSQLGLMIAYGLWFAVSEYRAARHTTDQ